MNVSDPGDMVDMTATWTTEGLPSPTVVCTLRLPDNTLVDVTPVDVTVNGSTVTAEAFYTVPRNNTAVGLYRGDFYSTGNPTAVESFWFFVRRSAVLA